MAAPKENEFWKLRSKHGRDKLFGSPTDLWDAACEYFQWCEDNPLQEEIAFHYKGIVSKDSLSKIRPFTIQGLCRYLDCNDVYLHQFELELKDKTDKESKDFSKIVTHIRDAIYQQKFEGAASGFLNANIIARDLGLKDRSDVTTDNKKLDEPHINLIVNGKNVKLK